MFAALSATNEAIMRAKSRTEMFELVCEAAAQGGQVQFDEHPSRQARQRLSSIWSPLQGRPRITPAV